MTSQARIDANRTNSTHSTGPKSAAGKQRVAQNALKHGLSAKTVVLPHEDAEEYQHRRLTWKRELGPLGDLGDYLADLESHARYDAALRCAQDRVLQAVARELELAGLGFR